MFNKSNFALGYKRELRYAKNSLRIRGEHNNSLDKYNKTKKFL